MTRKELCLKLAYSESEEEVIKILKAESLWENASNWKYFGDRENNYGDIGNQQSKSDGALVEKLINSVDAVLMLENYIRQNSETNYQQPESIKKALERFFNIYEGKLSNISPLERTKLSDKISLVATGKRSRPTYAIIDKGEGQSPRTMPNTLLSLGASNKLRIPFVQGKFNMGGTGILRFCGRNNFELIISRRNPQIDQKENDPTCDKWGFTLIRRISPRDGMRNSIYKYLVIDGAVPHFSSKSLPLLPKDYPEPYGGDFYWGTYIKLFEYEAGPLKSIITLNMNYRLSLLMPQLAIPIRLFERRKGFNAHTYETTLSGLDVRLGEDKSNNLEEKYRASGEITVNGQKLRYSIFPFKKGKIQNYAPKEGVIFTINGQTQGQLSKDFFKRKKVGLGYLADSLLVIADCTDFDGRAREDLFRNDRETLIACSLKTAIEKALEDELRNHKGLRLLQEERRKKEIENKLEDSKPLVDILSDILKKSPTLSKLLLQGIRLSNPFNLQGSENKKDYKGKQFPSYFKLIKQYPYEQPKEAQIDKRFRIKYKTDVSNDYFERSKDPGTFELSINEELVANKSINCWNGYANLSVLVKDFNIGDIVKFKSKVWDVHNLAQPFEEEFFIKIVPRKKQNAGKGKRTDPASDNSGDVTKMLDKLALPNIIHVRKKDWEKHDFNEKSSLRIVTTGNNHYDFYINLDNIHLLTEQKYSSPENVKLIEARYKYGMVLIALALLNEEDNNEKDDGGFLEEIRIFTDKISVVLIPMINSLGDLQIEEIEESLVETDY